MEQRFLRIKDVWRIEGIRSSLLYTTGDLERIRRAKGEP